MDVSNDVLKGYVADLCGDIRAAYTIDGDQYKKHIIKRGLQGLR